MRPTVDKVKRLLRAGAGLGTAIREALGMSISAFAAKHDLPRTFVNSQLTGRIEFSEPVLDALIAELGGTREEWMTIQHEARRPAKVA